MKKKILLVEDEALLAMAKQQELAGYNYETSHVTTGEKAVELVCSQNEPIDLILMDIDLGSGIDGTEAARQILEYKEIPIVFLSSHEEPEIVEKTEKITSYGYVVKSSSITVLDASIKMAFKLYESRIREGEKEKELSRNEGRLSLAMDAAEHGFWDWNITTGDAYFSPRWYTMLGYEPGELPMSFDTWVDLLHPDSIDVIDHINQHVKNAEPFSEEFQLRCKDGSYKWIRGQGKSYEFDREKHPTRVVGIHTDITEKKKYEDALRLSEQLLTETGKMVRTGGWEVDVASATVYWTKATKMIYEVPENFEPTIEGAMTYFPGESGEKLREAYRLAVEEGLDYDLELDFITAKGNALKVRDIGRAVIKDGKCRKVYGVFQDITEKQKAEHDLKEAENRFKAFMNYLPGAAFIKDKENKLLFCNKQFSRMLNKSPEQMIGLYIDEDVDPEIEKGYRKENREVIEDGKLLSSESVFTYKGKNTYWLTYKFPIETESGRLLGAVSIEITDRKIAEEELKISANRHKSLLHAIPDMFFLLDSQGTYIDYKKDNSGILNVPPEEFIGNTVTQMLSSEIAEQIMYHIREALTTKEIQHFAHEMTIEDKTYYFETRMSAVDNEHVVSIVQDVTERKNTELFLAESERKYKLITENTSDVLWIFNLEKKIFTYVSPSVFALRGYTPEEAMMQDINQSLTPESAEQVVNDIKVRLEKFLKNPAGENFYLDELRQPCKDGSIMWIETSTRYRFNRNNEVEVLGISRNIEERKKAEQKLLSAKADLEALLDNSDISFVLINRDLTIRAFNNKADEGSKAVFRKSLEKGLSMMDFTIPETKERFLNNFNECLHGKIHKIDHGVPVDKPERWFNFTYYPVKDHENNITGVLFSSIDITDRKKAEEERRKSDERFRIAQDMSPDGFTIFKPVRDDQNRIIDFIWVYQNAAIARMNGTAPQKVVGRRFLDIFPGAKDTQFIGIYKQVAESGKPMTFEDAYVGETMKTKSWFRITVVPMGENIAILAHDITEQKKAESRLKVSEDKYRSIFENSVLGIFRSTPEGKYEIVNKAFARILGFNSSEELLNEVTDISKLYKYPEDRERIKREFAEKGFVEDYEVLANHPENEIAWISINASQRQYPDGYFYYEGTIQDITERKQAEEELRKAIKEKDYLMKELNHRVKNSLLMVSSLISLKNSETETDLSDIEHQIKAISLIHEKLYQTERVAEIYCRDYFKDLLSSIFLSFSKRAVSLEANIDEIYLPTKTAMSLGLIINEIATNAVKHGFTDKEEAVFSITLKMDKDNNQYELSLSNTGKPFPEDVDIKSTNTLGLRLINALAAQLGGTVELQRMPNPVFTIKIPIED